MKVLLNWFAALLFLFLFLLFLQGAAISLLFRKLVRLQYGSHRESWVQDGKPTGPFFYPPETRTWRGLVVRWSSWQASSKRFWAWLFDTPSWIRQDRRALRLLFWMRAMMLSWVVVYFAVGFFLIVVAA